MKTNDLLKDAKAMKAAKSDFDLHVMLIAKQESITPAKARFVAWLEGNAGLQSRLGQKEMKV